MVASVFFSYSHVDEALRDQVETQLALLKRQGIIDTWHDRRIGAGLAAGNDGIEGDFRRIDADRFAAVVYKQGQAVSRCTVFLGNRAFAGGIAYSASETSASNGYNELLSVEADDQSMFPRSMGMAAMSGNRDAAKLTQEGAAELYWGRLIERLQPSRWG